MTDEKYPIIQPDEFLLRELGEETVEKFLHMIFSPALSPAAFHGEIRRPLKSHKQITGPTFPEPEDELSEAEQRTIEAIKREVSPSKLW